MTQPVWEKNKFGAWGDPTVDWRGLDDAARFIAVNLKRWGRVGVSQYKEKWAGVRVYCSLGWHCLLSITHPGYASYYKYPKWLMTFDIYTGSRVVPFLFNWWVRPYHKWLYRQVYHRAVQKWPHLEENILRYADFPELLKGLGSYDKV